MTTFSRCRELREGNVLESFDVSVRRGMALPSLHPLPAQDGDIVLGGTGEGRAGWVHGAFQTPQK